MSSDLDISKIKELNLTIENLNKVNEERKTELRALKMNLDSLIKSYNEKYSENLSMDNIVEKFEILKKELLEKYNTTLELVNQIKSGNYKTLNTSDIYEDLKKICRKFW